MLNKLDEGFDIGSRRVGRGQPVFVIAEVGINHGGNVDLCAAMIKAAAQAGADAVKLQMIDADESYVQGTTSYSEFMGKNLDDEALCAMIDLAKNLQIELFATPGDFSSLERMLRVGMSAVKISSGLMTNTPLISAAAQTGLPIIISTGLAYEEEIAAALGAANSSRSKGVALLKCTALYPAPDETINLLGIPAFRRRFGVPIGYSDHTFDGLACEAAVAIGARLVEKHFTLDRSSPGADHHISMEPPDFKNMVDRIRRLEVMRGDEVISPVPAEELLRSERHRCLVAKCDIKAGEYFSPENVALKRPLPGFPGLPPRLHNHLMGCRAAVNMRRDEPIIAEAVIEKL
jgi:N,N'-diacetyllegionaminate synthase